MGNIVTLSGGQHLDMQALLPWYVTRRLDASERARVEAHLAECAECRADVAVERRLAAEWASLPIETETSWLHFRERVMRDDVAHARSAMFSRLVDTVRHAFALGRPWFTGMGWALAAVQAAVLLAVVVPVRPTAPVYHTLSASQSPLTGNVLVMFSPDTSERRLRNALEVNNARIVDGPTAGGAYVLHVPADERRSALARMQAEPDVELAQPIDPGAVR
jgi:hypothetical protein